jgi:F0F1-type ATP synthase epsilon subunit
MSGMRSILVKFMKDSVVRGCLLQLLYQRRSEGSIPFGRIDQAVPPPGGISRRDWLRAVAQLSEYHLIDWTPLEDKSGMGQLSGFAKINDFGVKVLEAGAESPIEISIDETRRAIVPQQQQAPIATSTPQQQMIADAFEKVITAINQADVSEEEKNEAKSLLRKLLSSKAAAKVLGAGAQSLVAKYFTG